VQRRRRAALAMVGAVVLGVACAEYVVAPQERTPRALQLDASQYTVDEGQQVSIIATVLDQFGTAFAQLPAGINIAWNTSDPSILSVNTAGVLSGVSAGTGKVTAVASGDFGQFTVAADVTVRPLVSSLTLVAGDGQTGTVGQALANRLQVRVLNRLGAGVKGIVVNFAVTAGGGSLDSTSVKTDSTGLASAGLTLGTTTGADTVQATTPRLPGTVVVFAAQANPGAVTALARDSGDAQTGGSGTLLPVALVVRAVDRYGNAVPGVTVSWAIASGGGSITPASSVTNAQGRTRAQWTLGSTAGTETATASVGGALTVTFTATAVVPAASVTVTPNPASVASGATQQMTATPKDAGGNVLTGRTAIWSTSDATIATVSASGLVTGIKVGSVTITATVDGVNGTATVNVTPGPASTSTSVVTVSAPMVLVGGTVTFTLTTKDAAGNALTAGGLSVGFSTSGGTSAGTIGSVSDLANGSYSAVFTATTPGTPVSVGATIGGQAVTSTLPTVQVAMDTVVASVAVTPNPVSIASGTTQQMTATSKNAAGTVLTGKPVTWASGTPGVASVNGTGLVTGALVGTATITATVQGVQGTASVTVTPGLASPSQSVVTVSSSTVTVGGTVTLKLTSKDAAGNTVSVGGRTVLFTQTGGTSAGTVGAVTDSGDGTYVATFTATTAGTPVIISATIDGVALTTSPPTIQVNAAPSPLVHWINTAGGQWSNASNWSPARVPTTTDTAVVDAPGKYLVTNTGSDVGGLVVGAASGGGASVEFDGAATIAGAVHVQTGDTLYINNVVIVGSFLNDGVISLLDGNGGEVGVALAIDTVGVRTAVNNGTILGATNSVLNVSRATSLVNHGTIDPGVPHASVTSQLAVAGNVTLGSGSVVVIDLAGTAAGAYDVLGVGGTATLGDTLVVLTDYPFGPHVGDSFVVMTWGARVGTFGTIYLPSFPSRQWQVTYLPVGLMLSVVPGAGSGVAAYQGDGQSANAGSAVAVPPAVQVLDQNSNPVQGASVTFAVASGGGTISGAATVTTNSSGIAQVGGWTLGPTPGTNTLTATVSGSGINGNPVTFTATATTPALTWTGAISTDWSNPGNWSPAAVPNAGYDVTIVPATNEPTLTGTSAANNLTISGSGALLRINGQTLSLGALNVTNYGVLIMTNTADIVNVSGGAFFDGGNESGGLTAGQLRVGGNFNQNQDYSTTSFAASGTHTVALTGTSLQQVTFVTTSGASSFQNLDISASAGMNIQFDFNGLAVKGTFTSMPTGTTPLLYGLGRSLTAKQMLISGLTVDECPLILNEGSTAASEQLDNVTFQDFRLTNGTAPYNQFTFSGPGAGRTLTFNNLTFATTLSTGDTGHYLSVTANSGSLTVNIAGYNVSNGPTFTTTTGSVTVNWQ